MEKKLTIELVKSLNGRNDKHIATAASLGLHKIGQIHIECMDDRGREEEHKKVTDPHHPVAGFGDIAAVDIRIAVCNEQYGRACPHQKQGQPSDF